MYDDSCGGRAGVDSYVVIYVWLFTCIDSCVVIHM